MTIARKLTRPVGGREFRKYYLLATEGSVTEPEYFDKINRLNATIKIQCIRRSHGRSAPRYVLEDMKRYLKDNAITENYEAWLIIDRDRWQQEDILELHSWANSRNEYNLSISNPDFEYWILLHYEDGTNCPGKVAINSKLEKHIPNYDKHVNNINFKEDMISDAIRRGRQRDTTPTDVFPHCPGSRVYLLVEALLKT